MLLKLSPSILVVGLIATAGPVGAAQDYSSSEDRVIAHNMPKFAAVAKDKGPVEPSSPLNVSVWLNVHNPTELDSLAESLYDPSSPNFRHWLSKEEFAARYAPTAAEAKTVAEFLNSNHLSVVAIGPDNFFVTAKGTVEAVQKAFHVAIHQFELNGQIYRANTSDPTVTGAAGPLVSAVYGLDNLRFAHPYETTASTRNPTKTPPPAGGAARAAAVGSAAHADPAFFTSACLTGTRTESYSGVDLFGNPVSGVFSGNGFTTNVEGCGYTPVQIHTAYNLNALYQEGYDGAGQTIVIIDWCGSPTIRTDANAFSAKFGLPTLTASSFKIIEYPTPSSCAAPDPEINIDVEWAHAVAPGANITLLVPPTPLFTDVDNAFLYAAVNQLGSVISGSYGSTEIYTPETILVTENLIAKVAAVMGESANFSSGDTGDDTFDSPLASPSVIAPGDSPWATAVGGISLVLNSNNTIKFQTGWGTNENVLNLQGSIPDPPTGGYFNFGSGGGSSATFAKPKFQSKLHGKFRQLPDISWLADPFTGGVIAISNGFQDPPLTYQVYGGTSLACPMFSALWAIANQEAGYPLGQAAAYLYNLPSGAITDVLPYSSTTNVKATITDLSGTTTYKPDAVAAPLDGTTKYVSTLWDYPLNEDLVLLLTFGTDSGLTVTPGWDNVTGLGTPNGKVFADSFKPAALSSRK